MNLKFNPNPEALMFHAADDADGGDDSFDFSLDGLSDEQSDGEGGEEGGETVDFSGEEGQASEQPELFTVKVQGEEMQLTKEQLLSLASQGADYTRKTQALAAERNELAKAKALMDFLAQNEALGEVVAKQYFEATTGTPFTPESVQAVQMDGQAAQLEMQERKLAVANTLLDFRTAHPDVDDSSMDVLVNYMSDKKIMDPEVAFESLMYKRRGVEQRQQARPRISGGHGAPVRSVKKPETMEEASDMALALLRGERGQQNSY